MDKLLFLILFDLFRNGLPAFIDGCPAYGCRPSGSFSFYLKVPTTNVTIDWGTSFILNAVPNALGCASNTVSIICQSNGPFSDNKGYVSLKRENGEIRWRDSILVHPTLPLLDNYGDVTGSDGDNLVHYDADGKKYPKIDCGGLAPIYSIELIGSDFLLLASTKGDIVVRLTNGVPVGYIRLDDVIGDIRGTFVPIGQPVVNEMRFYVLTEFVPIVETPSHLYSAVQRLYAIDVRHSISARITVAWNYTFQSQMNEDNQNAETSIITSREDHLQYVETRAANGSQALLWKAQSKTLFINLPPVFNTTTKSSVLLGVQDNGTKPILNFRSQFQVLHMTSFEKDHCDNACAEDTPVWAANKSTICSINNRGLQGNCFILSDVIGPLAMISTKISSVRNDDGDSDILVFGVSSTISGDVKLNGDDLSLSFGVKATSSFLIAIQTNSASPKLLWQVPIPGGLEVKGQITGSSGSSSLTKDKLIFYSENVQGVARIYSVS